MDWTLKLLRPVGLLLVGGLCLHVIGCLSVRRLLFIRDPVTLDQVREEAALAGLRLWPEDGPAYRGLVSAAPGPASNGTVVVFHGNAGLAVHRVHYRDALERLGFRVVLAEYPAYGARPGSLSETHLVRDAVRTAETARDQFGGPLYLWGESLGCAIASAAAATLKDSTAGLILLTPWDNLPDLARHLYPHLPVRLFLRERYDNAAHLARYGGPTAFLIAERDSIIPPLHARRLYDGYAGPKRLWTFSDSDHNDWPAHPTAPWWREVTEFLTRSQ